MKVEKASTIFYWEWFDTFFQVLTDEQTGRLCKELVEFDRNGVFPEEEPLILAMFQNMANATVRNREKYNERCRKNREIAQFREWQRKNPDKTEADYEKYLSEKEQARTCTNVTDNDSDNECDNYPENDNYHEPEPENYIDKERDKGKPSGGTISGNTLYGYWKLDDLKMLCKEVNVPFEQFTESQLHQMGKAINEREAKTIIKEMLKGI